MKCYIHTDAEAVGTCTTCGKAICEQCAVDVGSRLVCRNCLAPGQRSGDKDPNTAFLIEVVGGFFGLLGIGYIYAGRTSEGVTRLVAWLIYDVTAAIVISLLLAVIVGVICIPIQLAVQIAVPLWSANALKKQMLGSS